MAHFEKQEAAYFLEKADQLFRLIKHARSDGIPQEEFYVELEALAHEFMRRAVEIQTKCDKSANATKI